jgi:hypothetical protein
MSGKLAVFSKKVNHLLSNSVLAESYYISGFGINLNIHFRVTVTEYMLASIIDDWLYIYLIISFYLIILICKNVKVQERY